MKQTTALAVVGVILCSCSQKMDRGPRANAYTPPALRHPPAETIPLGVPLPGSVLASGMEKGAPVIRSPIPPSRELLLRGGQQFNIFCAPCHGRGGDGLGMVVRRGFTRPPSFYAPMIADAPDGQLFRAISMGFGDMYGFGDRIPPRDRWAVIAYIRALEWSRHVPRARLGPRDLKELRGKAAGP